MSESCNSRHFSWLMKPCRPNPHDPPPICPCATISIPSHSSTSLPHHHSAKAKTTISLLPDDVLLEILSRLPLSSLPSLPMVCRRWSHLLDTPDFLYLRRHHRLLHPTLYALSLSDYGLHVSSVRLDLNQASWKTSLYHPNGTVLCASDLHGLFSNARLVSVGRKIFILTRNRTAQYDSWTGSVRFKPTMLFPRKKFAAAVLGGKIYVAGGAVRTSAVEEYDPHKNTWRVVTDAPRRRYGCIGVGINGVFYVIGGFKIGGGGINSSHSNNRIRSLEVASISRAAATVVGNEARIYASSMDLYDVESGNWLRSRAVPGGGCVVAACGAYDHVYVLASHAVELSFWRFHGRRKNVPGCSIAGGSNRGVINGGGGGFGEWCRMKSPPLPPQVRLDSMVRFCCVGMEDKVVMIQVTGCIDDLLRRSGRGGVRGNREGLVLVFDCVTGEWSRGADLPHVIQRAACVCLEC